MNITKEQLEQLLKETKVIITTSFKPFYITIEKPVEKKLGNKENCYVLYRAKWCKL